MKQPGFLKSLSHACNGLAVTINTQRNARIHLAAGIAVLALAFWLELDQIRFCILVLTIGAVIASETINTTVEAIVDLLSPEWHERAKTAKDIAAGAVLIVSLSAVVIGILIFAPPLWEKLHSPAPMVDLSWSCEIMPQIVCHSADTAIRGFRG